MKKHPDKKYVVLGTNSIMEKMRVCNLFRKFNYHERFEKLFQLANEILKLVRTFYKLFLLSKDICIKITLVFLVDEVL